MELILTRIAKRKGYTIGRLAIRECVDDVYLAGSRRKYLCDTLEPPALEMKTRVDRQTVLRSVMKVKGLKPFAIPARRSSTSGCRCSWATRTSTDYSRAYASMRATPPRTPRAAYYLARTSGKVWCSTPPDG